MVGSTISLAYTQAEVPDCICVIPVDEFKDVVTTSPLTPGLYTVTVQILNCRDLFTAGITEVLVPESISTRLELTSLPNPSRPYSGFVLTAIVSGGGPVPTGSVNFSGVVSCPQPCAHPSIPIGSVLLDGNGRATLPFPFLLFRPGEYALQAFYDGDANHGSAWGELSHRISESASTIPMLDREAFVLLSVLLGLAAVLILKRQGG